MMLMPSNNSSGIVHYFSGRYPGRIGWLMSPDGWHTPPFYMPYALDNGAFKGFDANKFNQHLQKPYGLHRPLWVAVPDVVADAEGTMELWKEWEDKISDMGYKLAFVAQDGMEPQDVPTSAHCVFIGGSTEWKIKAAHKFKGVAKLLHIGRVNTIGRLRWAIDIGADSCDGTGWFRGRGKQYFDLLDWFEPRQLSIEVLK